MKGATQNKKEERKMYRYIRSDDLDFCLLKRTTELQTDRRTDMLAIAKSCSGITEHDKHENIKTINTH